VLIIHSNRMRMWRLWIKDVLGMSKSMIVIAMMAMSALLIAFVGRERALTVVFGPIEIKSFDFANLLLDPRPNRFLVCPVDYCTVKPHMISPIFSVTADALRQRWMSVIAAQPRIETGAVDDPAMQYDYIQRSAVMLYPDSITVRFIPLENGRSTLAIYSRSHYGNSDFGVNENRIQVWLAALVD
jgi:uncharacterized protein (DUF1499 family)